MSCKTKADMMLALWPGVYCFRPATLLGCSALLEAGMEPSPHPLYHCGFCISFGSRWVVRIRQARRAAETAPSPGWPVWGSHTAHKILSKKGCTCWKKKVGVADGQLTGTRTWEEKHTEILHLDQRALFSHEHSLFMPEPTHTRKMLCRPLLRSGIPGDLRMTVKLIKHLRVHYHRVFRNRMLVQES